jgi:nitrite reductase/ring-hydroxylating ferredoxin subunit
LAAREIKEDGTTRFHSLPSLRSHPIAEAANWRNSAMADNGLNVVRVCAQADVPPGTVRAFAVGSNTLAVYNIDGAYYITDDECTHAAASLADGMLDGDVIECCMHMGSFHVPTGNVVTPPCEVPLRTYKVVLEGDDVFVDLAHNAAGEPQ